MVLSVFVTAAVRLCCLSNLHRQRLGAGAASVRHRRTLGPTS